MELENSYIKCVFVLCIAVSVVPYLYMDIIIGNKTQRNNNFHHICCVLLPENMTKQQSRPNFTPPYFLAQLLYLESTIQSRAQGWR